MHIRDKRERGNNRIIALFHTHHSLLLTTKQCNARSKQEIEQRRVSHYKGPHKTHNCTQNEKV